MFDKRRDNKGPDSSFSAQEQATTPSIPSLIAAAAVEQARTRTWEAVSPIEREQDVLTQICTTDGINQNEIQNVRKAVGAGKLLFAEYLNGFARATYLYITPDHKVPDYVSTSVWLDPDMLHPTTPILVKINHRCEVKVLHRWED